MNRRSGFTLIELVVVLAILGLLLALLMPAIQSAREASRRVACQNRLRQVDAAVLLYESAHRELPPLYNGTFLPSPRSALDEFHCHPWRTLILPQLEQSALFASLNLACPSTISANQTALNVTIEVFLCPSTPASSPTVPGIGAWNNGGFSHEVVGTACRSDYEILGGVWLERPRVSHPNLGGVGLGPWGEPTYKDGAALRDRIARLVDISDGLSHTILVAEKAGRPTWYRPGEPPDEYPYRNLDLSPDPNQAAWGVSTHFEWLIFDASQGVNVSNVTGVYAFHPGGANVAMADGSVRFLKQSAGPVALRALTTRARGELTPAE